MSTKDAARITRQDGQDRRKPRRWVIVILVILGLLLTPLIIAVGLFSGGVALLAIVTYIDNPEMYICRGTNPAANYSSVKEWHLPLSIFPPNWYLEGNSEIKIHATREMYNRALFLADWRYNYVGRDEHDAYTSHEIAVYGSPECAHGDYDYLSDSEGNILSWGPITNWMYSSLADEYNIAIENPAWDDNASGNRLIRVRIIARYGTIVSYFHMFTYESDITVDQVQRLVTSMDEKLYAYSRTWRDTVNP